MTWALGTGALTMGLVPGFITVGGVRLTGSGKQVGSLLGNLFGRTARLVSLTGSPDPNPKKELADDFMVTRPLNVFFPSDLSCQSFNWINTCLPDQHP